MANDGEDFYITACQCIENNVGSGGAIYGKATHGMLEYVECNCVFYMLTSGRCSYQTSSIFL